MTRNRHGRFELLRRWHRKLWLTRRFHQVNIEVICTRMIVFGAHRRLERKLRLFGARTRCAVFLPVVPTRGVHKARGEHRADVRVVGVFFMQLAHGIDKSEVAFANVHNGVFVVEHEKRADHVLLARCRVVDTPQRFTNRIKTRALGIVRHASIATVRVWTCRMRQAEIRHGAVGV